MDKSLPLRAQALPGLDAGEVAADVADDDTRGSRHTPHTCQICAPDHAAPELTPDS